MAEPQRIGRIYRNRLTHDDIFYHLDMIDCLFGYTLYNCTNTTARRLDRLDVSLAAPSKENGVVCDHLFTVARNRMAMHNTGRVFVSTRQRRRRCKRENLANTASGVKYGLIESNCTLLEQVTLTLEYINSINASTSETRYIENGRPYKCVPLLMYPALPFSQQNPLNSTPLLHVSLCMDHKHPIKPLLLLQTVNLLFFKVKSIITSAINVTLRTRQIIRQRAGPASQGGRCSHCQILQ